MLLKWFSRVIIGWVRLKNNYSHVPLSFDVMGLMVWENDKFQMTNDK